MSAPGEPNSLKRGLISLHKVPDLLVVNVFVRLRKKRYVLAAHTRDAVTYLEFVLKLLGESQYIAVKPTASENYRVASVRI